LQTQVSQLQTTGEAQEDFFGLRWFLVFVALLEGFEALLDLPLLIDRPNLLFGPWAVPPTTALGVFVAKLYVVAHPLLAIAALALSVAGNVRGALLALAAICVVTWLHLLPVVFQDGVQFQSWWALQWAVAQFVVFPMLAAITIALAVLTRRYRLAAALIAIPTMHNILGTIVFVVNVIAANL
jgi:hypothetical protein